MTRIRPLPPAQRTAVLRAAAGGRFAQPEHAARLARLAESGNDGALWQADHVVPVSEGGGLCGLDNMRTLCVLCHGEQTAQLASHRAQRARGGVGGFARVVKPRQLSDEERAVQAAARARWEEEGDAEFVGTRMVAAKKAATASSKKGRAKDGK